jgi:hypothetical protein
MENNYQNKQDGLPAKFEVLTQVYFSYMLIFSKLRRGAGHKYPAFKKQIGPIGY